MLEEYFVLFEQLKPPENMSYETCGLGRLDKSKNGQSHHHDLIVT